MKETESSEAYSNSVAEKLWGDSSKRGTLFIDLDDSFYHPKIPSVSVDLYERCIKEKWPVIIVTGNAFEGVLPRVLSDQIPAPHIIVGSVGTEIWVLQEGAALQNAYSKDVEFEQHIIAKGYNRYDVAKKGEELIEQMAKTQPHHNFSFQHPEREHNYLHEGESTPEPYKVSFYYYTDNIEDLKDLKNEIQNIFPTHTILISYHTTYNNQHVNDPVKAFCVDILPIGKAGAVSYLTQKLSISGGLVVGDSGNDVEMLLESSPNLISLLVGGAKDEAKPMVTSDTSIQVEDWRVNLFTMQGQTKKCCVDESATRLGPESVLAAFQNLHSFKNIEL